MSEDAGERIRTEKDDAPSQATSSPPPPQHSADSSGRDEPQQQPHGQTNQANTPAVQTLMMEHIMANKIDCAMLGTRLLTIFFTMLYVVPIIGTQQSAFNRVLIANAATSALRLNQRLPVISFTREFLARLFVEDSCHYLLYSFMFFNVQPTFLILLPIVLFAVLHASSYSLKLLDIIGQNAWWGARFLISLVEFQAANILKAAAFSEVFIMPLSIILTFMGRAGLMTPVVYYHFLVMRYSSRRNPYTRNAFTELRMATEALANRSPPFVHKVLHNCIALISRFAPQQMPQEER